ncbi:MAG: glutathione peroxidase [Bacteroidetes bacterium]|nr:glutathione peroxidase [Bacteroidota bacterium]
MMIMSLMGFMLMVGSGDAQTRPASRETEGVLKFTMKDIDGNDVPLSRYKGKAILIVNVASRCGYTPQYEGLEKLYRTYRDSGLVVLGFPANNFGAQEPGTDEQIKEFCTTTYGVTFDMFSKISVKGDDQHPLYRYLTSPETNPAFAGDVAWNFTKFLVNREGTIIGKFGSRVKPMSEELITAVEKALR